MAFGTKPKNPVGILGDVSLLKNWSEQTRWVVFSCQLNWPRPFRNRQPRVEAFKFAWMLFFELRPQSDVVMLGKENCFQLTRSASIDVKRFWWDLFAAKTWRLQCVDHRAFAVRRVNSENKAARTRRVCPRCPSKYHPCVSQRLFDQSRRPRA